ncbi:MAG TPA: methionine adenosyltransferase [Candidatus Korarchaeota archaeon]|nr:methionine adenosyltransferase [Candidatus Korarchaeota archaeon]
MARVVVEESVRVPMDDQPIEIVERKGIGHPDTICDAIMERVSLELSREYLRRFGGLLHYNADKSLLAAGVTEPAFGGGRVIKPMLIVFGDRATNSFAGEEIPIEEIVIQAAKNWIRENLRFVDPDEHVRYQVELKPGSAELTDIFKRGSGPLGANDTSAAVGYAPLSRTERAVLEVEKFLNSPEFKKRHPETGEDVKVMGYRVGDRLDITVALAFVDRYIASESEYFRMKGEVLEELNSFVRDRYDFEEINIALNTLDRPGRGVGGVYLTVLGTSAEGGDSGQVGRGNGVNGVIPLMRPRSSEAAAGKNPVSHVGKIYNVLTHHIAQKIHEEVSGVREAYVWLLSRIGHPINDPALAAAEVSVERGVTLDDVKPAVEEVMVKELEDIGRFVERLIDGEIPTY